jgi:hypothetical protein
LIVYTIKMGIRIPVIKITLIKTTRGLPCRFMNFYVPIAIESLVFSRNHSKKTGYPTVLNATGLK